AEFQSLEAAGLELGYRYNWWGALVRHVPDLVDASVGVRPVSLAIEDELRFVFYHMGARWVRWVLMRALSSGYGPRFALLRAWLYVRTQPRPPKPVPYRHPVSAGTRDLRGTRVSVLVPTLERY